MKSTLSKTILALLFIGFGYGYGIAQVRTANLYKTWQLEAIETASGEYQKPSEKMEDDFILFLADGTYESLNLGRLSIRGKWELQKSKNLLILTQQQTREYPAVLRLEIQSLSQTELIVKGKDPKGNSLTMYYREKF